MFAPELYQIAIGFFIRLLGFIYFFAFGAFIFQVLGLFGREGILPIKEYVTSFKMRFGNKSFKIIPSLFLFNSSDKALLSVVILGTCLSILLLFNVYPPLLLFLLYVLYLSIVSTGQEFLSFGWEMFLLELTVHAFFLSLSPLNPFIWISLNLQLFRFHFQGGIVKLLSRDPNWRNLTAVWYHYQSQPLPNTIAWFAYKLPLWFQKASTFIMFVAELAIPFLLFFNQPEIRLFVFACLFGLQFMIWFTGNFSFLNYLTAIFCIILIGDAYLLPFFSMPQNIEPAFWVNFLVSIAGCTLIALQLMTVWNHLIIPNKIFSKILHAIQPFHLANRYGIFAIMTTIRYEVVIEGSNDGVNWKEYCFYFKPSEITRRPRRNSPYQPRIDWQAWFLPFTNYASERWFQSFLYHILKGTKPVTSLLRINPFENKPPRYVRALLYEYEYSTSEEKKNLGIWWRRKLVGHYSPTLSLK